MGQGPVVLRNAQQQGIGTQNSGTIDQHIDRPEFFVRAVDEMKNIAFFGDIALLKKNVPTWGIKLFGQFIQFAFVGIRNGDASAGIS
jgi:hypothetical protein